jgi:diaminobutyrate-2-oxoglutarate transaminase
MPYAESINAFDRYESEARYYCRKNSAVFVKALNARVWDEEGREYIDFLSACGSLNYGHNHPVLKAAAIDYLHGEGLINSLDFHTAAKRKFIEKFRTLILEPRGLNYKIQFTGPTGANAVEAALKLARKASGRKSTVAFTNAFHGMSLGALSVSGSAAARSSSAGLLHEVVRLPFEGYCGAGEQELVRFAQMAVDPSSGIESPAAFIIETVQGEGGLNVASASWLNRLADIAKQLNSLLIVDDIQAGCGRTGTFFSFEGSGVMPDLVCLSKSISGLGLPMSILLINPEVDCWNPGEHNGTFRGNNLAFVTAAAALDFWADVAFKRHIDNLCQMLEAELARIVASHSRLGLTLKGRGLMRGIQFEDASRALAVNECLVQQRMLIENAGPCDEVVKIMPPLTIEPETLSEGLDRLSAAIEQLSRRSVLRAA